MAEVFLNRGDRLPFSWRNVHDVSLPDVQLDWPLARIGKQIWRIGLVHESEDGDVIDWGDDDYARE